MENNNVFDVLLANLEKTEGCETLKTIYKEMKDNSEKSHTVARCNCGMNHDMTFCGNAVCRAKEACARHESYHRLGSYYSLSVFEIDEETKECDYFIERRRV